MPSLDIHYMDVKIYELTKPGRSSMFEMEVATNMRGLHP